MVGLLILAVVASPFSVGAGFGYAFPPDADVEVRWESVAATPGGADENPPQGIAALGAQIVLNTHFRDTKSVAYVLDSEGVVVTEVTLPTEAVHVAGLAWDGEGLWAVDYGNGRLYVLNWAASLDAGKAIVRRVYPTGLAGASGLTLLDHDGVRYVGISEFGGTERTWIVPLDRLSELAPSVAVPDVAAFSYDNGGFSQGLTWDGTFLYDAVNTSGTDRVLVVDPRPGFAGADEVPVLGTFEAPGPFVEDLVAVGDVLWTSDEHTYEVYRTGDLGTVRAHFLARR